MLLPWSRGVELRGGGAAPVLTWIILALALLVQVVHATALHLPPWLVSAVAALRLNSDPAQALFAPWQLWSAVLVHGGWLALLLSGLAFAILGGGLERRVGTRLFALAVMVVAPLGWAIPLIAGVATPALGLGPVAAGCAGGLMAVAPTAALRLDLWWWALVALGRMRLRIGLHWILAGFVALEAWRLAALPRTGLGALDRDFLPLHVGGLILVVAAGHLLGRSLAGLRDQAALQPLARLAAGEGSLDQLEPALDALEAPPAAHLAAIGERAMREGHRAAAALLLARLALIAPESGIARRLRVWLAGDGAGDR